MNPQAHGHAPTPEAGDAKPGYYEIMEIAVRELLIEKKVIEPSEVRRMLEVMDSRTPALGAKVVARAWVDPEFRSRLLANGRAACEELGIDFFEDTQLIVLENTDKVHNLICCTLCSCYPWPVLGLPPVWYKSFEYRSRIVREPRAVLHEFGLDISPNVELRVWDSSSELRYLVLPERPPGTEGMSEAELTALVTRDSMIGVAKASAPQG